MTIVIINERLVMKTMPAGQFKTHCLSVIDEVHDRHEEVIITKHVKPMAKLVPLEEASRNPDDIFGSMRGWGKIVGDIVSPVDPPDSWDMEK
jgi:prevent-host-death family protein